MTRLFNDPDAFADEMIEGFAAAHADLVRRVPGGVVRKSPAPAGKVAVVIGGGSGHYPAFAGLVGPGPRARRRDGQHLRLAIGAADLLGGPAAAHGGGVLLSYGNYAGDVLNFDAGSRNADAEGHPCRDPWPSPTTSPARPPTKSSNVAASPAT